MPEQYRMNRREAKERIKKKCKSQPTWLVIWLYYYYNFIPSIGRLAAAICRCRRRRCRFDYTINNNSKFCRTETCFHWAVEWRTMNEYPDYLFYYYFYCDCHCIPYGVVCDCVCVCGIVNHHHYHQPAAIVGHIFCCCCRCLCFRLLISWFGETIFLSIFDYFHVPQHNQLNHSTIPHWTTATAMATQ